MKIIGLSGTNGSGKDAVGQTLQELNNYLFISVTDLLREEATKRGLPIERSSLRMISAEWRREHGLGVLVDKAVEMYSQTKGHDGLVIASLRNPGEADSVHSLGGTVIWVDADPHVRYDRLTTRQRSDEDNKTFDEFLAEEQAEMTHEGDEATLNSAGVKQKADMVILNDGNDLEAFKQQVQVQLKDIIN